MSLRQWSAVIDNPFARKLGSLAQLSADDLAAINLMLCRGDQRVLPAKQELRAPDERAKRFSILTAGLAYRFRYLRDGSRQIFSFMLPGDSVDPVGRWGCDASYEVCTALDTTFVVFPILDDPLSSLVSQMSLAVALWRSRMQEENMLYERIATLGRRRADARLAALLCELYYRFDAVGLVHNGAMQLPFGQAEIADALGLSTVHVNRTMTYLRRMNLIEVDRQNVIVRDLPSLCQAADWDPDYLMLRGQTAIAEPQGPGAGRRAGGAASLSRAALSSAMTSSSDVCVKSL